MDEKFTKSLQEYLNAPEDQRDVAEGAMMLLQLNRNRIFYQNVVRRPDTYKAKLFYELAKQLKIRLDGMTINGIVEMDQKIPAIENTSIKQIKDAVGTDGVITLGKRPDHDELPESIKALYIENGVLAKDMRSFHEKLKLMGEAPACDRYEVLKLLVDADTKYRTNWTKYDNYKPGSGDDGKGEVVDANRVSANRKYLSLNKKKLGTLKEKQDLPKYHDLLEKMQVRYNELVIAGCALDPEKSKELVDLGLKA